MFQSSISVSSTHGSPQSRTYFVFQLSEDIVGGFGWLRMKGELSLRESSLYHAFSLFLSLWFSFSLPVSMGLSLSLTHTYPHNPYANMSSLAARRQSCNHRHQQLEPHKVEKAHRGVLMRFSAPKNADWGANCNSSLCKSSFYSFHYTFFVSTGRGKSGWANERKRKKLIWFMSRFNGRTSGAREQI